jgi:signal transduction histidine kinase
MIKMIAGVVMKNRAIDLRAKQSCTTEIECNHHHFKEFHRLHRSIKLLRPLFLVFNVIIVYLLFIWAGLKVIGISIAALIIFKEIIQLFFLRRLENRVLRPIDKLQGGFVEIARGNYDVSIDPCCENEFGELIRSFNEMASKLRESEKTNLEYEENRKNLIANISHDLKTPITSIQGYIEMIVDNDLVQPDKINQYLKTMYNNTKYMNKLIDDLFLFSKLDIDKLDFNLEIIDVRAFTGHLMDELRFELEEIGAEFTYQDKMNQAGSVSIDRKRVYQAIRNILGNAVKYGPETDLKISVVLYRQDDLACVSITDNGPGIAQEKLPYIFDRFYRIDNERSKDLVSTGLGLAIAKELVEAQGGKIMVSSSAETGSCFTICFPFYGTPENGV